MGRWEVEVPYSSLSSFGRGGCGADSELGNFLAGSVLLCLGVSRSSRFRVSSGTFHVLMPEDWASTFSVLLGG